MNHENHILDGLKLAAINGAAIIGAIPLSTVHEILAIAVLVTALAYNICKLISWKKEKNKKDNNE